jgi:hypothetical protein
MTPELQDMVKKLIAIVGLGEQKRDKLIFVLDLRVRGWNLSCGSPSGLSFTGLWLSSLCRSFCLQVETFTCSRGRCFTFSPVN